MWYYVFDSQTGQLLSESSIAPDPSLSFISRPTRLDAKSEVWDSSVKSAVAKVIVTSADETLRQSLVAKARGSWTLAEMADFAILWLKQQKF